MSTAGDHKGPPNLSTTTLAPTDSLHFLVDPSNAFAYTYSNQVYGS
jgi:hypothetical protein